MAGLKGALLSFMPPGGLGLPSMPNVIIFQINPETITHAWTEAAPPQPPSDAKVKVNPLAVTGVPGESFSFTLMLDSDEQISDIATDPIGGGLAEVSGVYTRLAALELLQFPTLSPTSSLVGQVSAASSAASMGTSAADSSTQSVPVSQVPVALFIWGPLRIVPVRVTVLTPDELAAVQGSMAGIAQAAYSYTLGLKQLQAVANLGESAASILGMLPIPM
jgi:hypothetical protein